MKASILTCLLCGTHMVALLIGTLSGLIYNAFSESRLDPQASVVTTLNAVKAHPDTNSEGRYDILPLLVLEHDIAPQDLRVILVEAQSSIRLDTKSKFYAIGPMYIYYPSQLTHVREYLKKVTADLQNVIIRPVPQTETRQQALLSLDLWSDLSRITDRVLTVDISSVLCSNPTKPVSYFVSQDYAWIGAAWEWASPANHSNHLGGNGALSVRSTRHLQQILTDHTHDKNNGGNEDMWFTSRLREWYDEGTPRNGIDAPKLPSQEEQQLFAVEVVPSPHGTTPTGIYHLMVAMEHGERDRMLASCPEAKRLFPVLHDRMCVKMSCPKNMTEYNFFEWEERQKQEGFDKCDEMCNIYHHPMAAKSKHWG